MLPTLVDTTANGKSGALQDRKIDFRNHREMLEENLLRQIEASRAADLKIALLVPTMTAMLGVLAAMMRDKPLDGPHLYWASLGAVPLLIAFALMAAGVIPRLRGTPSRSLLYFGDLSARTLIEATEAQLTLTPQAYLTDLAAQCHTTARIAHTKHQSVRRAYIGFLLALPFWLATIWLLNDV